MLASSGERMPPCGVPVLVSRVMPSSDEDPGFQERLDQPQDALVADASPHPGQQRRMRDFVEARRDVAFQHPLVGVGRQHVDLSDRVVGSTLRAEPVGARVEVRLEDRLEDQLERWPARPGPPRSESPGARSLPLRLGIIRSRTGTGANSPDLSCSRSPARNGPLEPTGADVGAPRRPRPIVLLDCPAPDPTRPSGTPGR